MKQINTLSDLVLPQIENIQRGATFTLGERMNRQQIIGGGEFEGNDERLVAALQHRRSKMKVEDQMGEVEKMTTTAAAANNSVSPDSTESSTLVGDFNSQTSPQTSSSQASSLGMDKKLLGGRQETPLSVLKVPPLGTFINNKVGSSYLPTTTSASMANRDALMSYREHLQQSAINNNYVLPVSNRKVRDSGSLLFMFAFLGFLGYIIWDGMIVKETDINLIVHGHDSYGNICGRNNQPIGVVEKSGKNFTTKPYTKYTLINSQFERYTLDSSRLKNGELIYVKEIELFGRTKALAGNEFDYKLQQQGDNLKYQLASGVIGSGNVNANAISRSPRSTATEMYVTDAMRRNQSLLNSLKSTLMYQYPPMYGYGPALNSRADSNNKQQPQHQRNSGGSPSNANGSKMAPAAAAYDGPHLDLDGSAQTELRFLKAAAVSSPAAITTTATATTATSSTTTTTLASPTKRAQMVFFDDHTDTDMDHYDDHMLITPTTSAPQPQLQPQPANQPPHQPVRPRNPLLPHPSDSGLINGLNQFEVSNQLLYLTECVDQCPSDYVELIFYRCLPKNWRFSLFPNAINVTRTFIDDILTDMSHCYRELIYIFSLALVLSLALLILLRFLASAIIWSCLTLLVTLLLSMASYSWLSYYYQILDLNQMMPHDSHYNERLATSDKWLIGSIFLTFISFACIGTVIFMRKRILLVTTLFRESGKAIADMPLLLIQPLLTFAVLVLITIVWSVGLICLQSMKMPVVDMHTGFVVFKAETLYKIMKWYHIFAFLWVSHFAIACQHYVIGASVSKWYFSPNRYNLNSPIGTSVSELILYYLGSVALGSFLVAIFKVFRIIVRQVQFLIQRNCMSPPTNNHSNSSSSSSLMSPQQASATTFCGSLSYVWRLFIWFFDNIVMIINRDAYVEIAIHGHSFLAGAKQAFTVLASNPLKLLAVKSVSNVLLVVAKICVVFGTVSMAIILLEEKKHTLNYSWSPIVISAFYAYIVAHWFLSVYEMVIDALFICYCEDFERTKDQEARFNQINGSNFMSQILNNGQIY